MIRVILPFHLRTLAHVGSEVTLEVADLKPVPGHTAFGAGRAHFHEKQARYPTLPSPHLANSARCGAPLGIPTRTRNRAAPSFASYLLESGLRRRPLPQTARRSRIREGAVYYHWGDCWRVRKNDQKMPFDLQPVLKGQHLELRPLRWEDFDALYAVASDPLIWEQHPANDRYKKEVFEEFFRGAMESGGAFIAVDCKNGQVMGSSRYHGYDQEKSEIEIGWTFLARSYWGGIYNREMKQLMLRHAFQFVNSVVFLVGPQNLRSQRAMEKIGGTRVGSRPDASGRESFVYRITASAFFDTFAQQQGGRT